MFEKLSFFGLGKIGLPLAALFARSALPTVATDVKPDLVDRLSRGIARYAEPGLDELLADAAPHIAYSTDAGRVAESDVSIISVATQGEGRQPGYSSSAVEKVCADICEALRLRPGRRQLTVIVSSTVPPGAIATRIAPMFSQHMARHPNQKIDLVYVPEFVALGDVVRGYTQPPFLVVGADDGAVGARVSNLFGRIVSPQTAVRHMSIANAEITKVAYNVYVCMKISFGNFLSQIGERREGLDQDVIAGTLAIAPVIGPGFMRGGFPYGGPCFPRDIDAFVAFANALGLDAPLASATARINEAQYELIEARTLESAPARVSVLGLSFKAGTTVAAASPGVEFARRLVRKGVKVAVYDPAPEACAEARAALRSGVEYVAELEESWRGANVVVVCNPDPEFACLADVIPPSVRIIDPWACVRGSHPGLVRIGRSRT